MMLLHEYCGLTIRTNDNSDDVKGLKRVIWVAYFNRFSTDENHCMMCALKLWIPLTGAVKPRSLVNTQNSEMYNTSSAVISVLKDLNYIRLFEKCLYTNKVL